MSAPPGDVVASSTDDVTLACDATTDARRAAHLLITWYRDELPVSEEGRVRVADAGSRLVIDDATVSDSGVYGCTASNGIDQDTATVVVTIKGPLPLILLPGPHQQQCRSNVGICRKDEISTQNSFDIVAVIGYKVERCFDIVAGVDGFLAIVAVSALGVSTKLFYVEHG